MNSSWTWAHTVPTLPKPLHCVIVSKCTLSIQVLNSIIWSSFPYALAGSGISNRAARVAMDAPTGTRYPRQQLHRLCHNASPLFILFNLPSSRWAASVLRRATGCPWRRLRSGNPEAECRHGECPFCIYWAWSRFTAWIKSLLCNCVMLRKSSGFPEPVSSSKTQVMKNSEVTYETHPVQNPTIKESRSRGLIRNSFYFG